MTASITQTTPRDEAVEVVRTADGQGFRLQCAQFLPQPRDRLFEFFGDAFQLEAITPPWLHFSVLTPAPIRIHVGTLIDYQLRLYRIPIRWQSCITVWEPPYRFVDEQIRGPYRYWRHEHQFDEVEGGTFCRDTVEYAVPGGRLVNALFVGPDLRRIFTFRQQRLAELHAADPSSRHAELI